MKLTLSRIALPTAALLLLGWWVVRGAGSPGAGPTGSESTAPPATVMPDRKPVTPIAKPRGQIPGYSAPPIETATPAEVAALVEAEVERSARSEPPKSFVGIDGTPKAFQYNQSALAGAREQARDVRRKLLMQELSADPQRFARDHQLTLKEVQWIVDGTGDFPDRMLD